MSVPKSVTRVTKDGVEFTSNVDRANYTIKELSRAALRDVGNFVLINCNRKAQKIRGLGKTKRVRGKNSTFEKWVRAKDCDLQIGTKQNMWYGLAQELGDSVTIGHRLSSGGISKGESKMPKLAIITSTVEENIAKIIEIESKYLSALEDEAEALSKISEEEYTGGADE